MSILKKLHSVAKNLTILYVEDDEEIRNQVVSYLEKIFKHVDTAQDGLEGLKLYQNKQYELILTDIQMPNMNGIEMSKEIKTLNINQKIIIISAYTETEYFLQTIRIGISGYILKPINYEQMNQTLLNIVTQIAQLHENIEYKNHLEQLVENQTAQIKQQTETLIIKAQTDQLTGLANHFVLLENLASKENRALILLNIDNFSAINDIYGFEQGDLVLQETAKLLQHLTPASAQLFRLDADEFVYLDNDTNIQTIKSTIQTIQSFFNSVAINSFGVEFNLTFTIGVDIGHDKEILGNAKTAIKEIREGGRNQFMFFNAASDFLKLQHQNLYWVHKIQKAIEEDRLVPYFQAILNNKTGKVEKYECLARIDNGHEIFSPWKFISGAERAGFLGNITKNIIHKSCQNFEHTQNEFSINITSHDLLQGELLDFLLKKTTQFSIEPKRLILEILEDITFTTETKIITYLREFQEHGFQIAIDDFGSENSNFSRLLKFRPDYIKIDGSFIRDITTDKQSFVITETIVNFAKKCGIKVIAEYVHNKATLDIVNSLGIDYSQGYYISEPKPTLEE